MSSAGIDPFNAAIAGSSQRVITPVNILANVGASSISTSTSLRLKVIASGPNTTGRFKASGPLQRCLAALYSSSCRGESEPPKSVLPERNSSIPAPDPLAVYFSDLPRPRHLSFTCWTFWPLLLQVTGSRLGHGAGGSTREPDI